MLFVVWSRSSCSQIVALVSLISIAEVGGIAIIFSICNVLIRWKVVKVFLEIHIHS